MAQEVKYLSYDGLSHLKDILEGRYEKKGHSHSYLPLAGGTMTGTINSQSIIPKTNTTYNLGSTANQFNVVYTRYIDTVSGYNLRLRAAGTEHINMLGGNVNVTANIIPTASNTYNLGSSAVKYANAYATTFTGNLKGAMTSIVTNSSSASITEIPNAIRFDSFLASNTTSGFGSGYNNAILTVGRFETTNYASQIGFSGNGKLYYRSFVGTALDDSKTWSQIALTSDIPTSLTNTEIDAIFTDLGVTF